MSPRLLGSLFLPERSFLNNTVSVKCFVGRGVFSYISTRHVSVFAEDVLVRIMTISTSVASVRIECRQMRHATVFQKNLMVHETTI